MSVRGPNGAQRAAAFLLSVHTDRAREILRHLDQRVLLSVVEAMGDLEPSLTKPDSVSRLYLDFAEYVDSPEGVRSKDDIELRRLLEESFDSEEAQRVLERMYQRRLQERPFLAIEYEPPSQIAVALRPESDAVVAAVLAHLQPGLSAKVLSVFDEERALAIVRRMATLIPPAFDTLVAISQEIAARIEQISSGPIPQDRTTRLKSIAELLSFADPHLEQSMLEGLNDSDDAMAAEIREHMFAWADLQSVDKRAMQQILASVDTRTLSIALKGAERNITENILSNLSSRVRDMVEEERELLGSMALSEVNRAREDLLRAVRTLIESGEFKPARAGEDLVS